MSDGDYGDNITDPKGCEHKWHPVSMVFETQLLDDRGRVSIRQPDLKAGRVYLVCLRCAQHTYMATNFVGYQLGGSEHRDFEFNPNSSHPYSLDGQTWRQERPTEDELAAVSGDQEGTSG